jgi:hypothetical protein
VVTPKPLRECLGLASAADVELVAVDGGVESRPVLAPTDVVEVEGRLVLQGDGFPALTDEAVRETIERTRR